MEETKHNLANASGQNQVETISKLTQLKLFKNQINHKTGAKL